VIPLVFRRRPPIRRLSASRHRRRRPGIKVIVLLALGALFLLALLSELLAGMG